uniref:Uncharacterized protein n=1 Tax=Gossypium raimondii TaxID=29730 RepID=A0A0D2Q472_GOSRA|nr:hypothetical protein B456_001G251200 [Gossypium raimondii]
MVVHTELQKLTTKFETLRMHESETLGEFYAKLCTLSNHTFALGNEYSCLKVVRKVLKYLLECFSIKATAIEEANDIDTIKNYELIGSLQKLEMNLDESR